MSRQDSLDNIIAAEGNLQVRLLHEDDLPHLLQWLADPRVLEFYEGRDTTWPADRIREHFFGPPDHNAEFIRVAICLDGTPVGYGQLYQLYGPLFEEYAYPDPGQPVYAMDQFLGVPELWGQGVGTRYVRLVTDFLVNLRGAVAVLLDPRKANTRAVRCYEKAGYRIVGELPAHELHEGTWQDCWLMEYVSAL